MKCSGGFPASSTCPARRLIVTKVSSADLRTCTYVAHVESLNIMIHCTHKTAKREVQRHMIYCCQNPPTRVTHAMRLTWSVDRSTVSLTFSPIAHCSSALNRSPPFNTCRPLSAMMTSPATTPPRPRRVANRPAAAAAPSGSTADSSAPLVTFSFCAIESGATCEH
jgi:hypothetical protein